MTTPFGHLDLRVTDMARAMPFYEGLLPALGFTQTYHSPAWKGWGTTDALPGAAYVAVTEDPAHRANANRVAFWAADRETVDRLAAVARQSGAQHVEGPEVMPYGPDYSAVYFEDPCGNRFEVYCRRA
jgi:catechol 2,3-dioxygenase-like lactoylglutathione lyase family enzyme